MRLHKRPRFLLDLAGELNWLNEKAGPDVAARWYESLKDTINQIRRHPFLGRERKDLSPPGIRSWRISGFPRWLLFYGFDEHDNLIFHRIRQGTMNLTVLKMDS